MKFYTKWMVIALSVFVALLIIANIVLVRVTTVNTKEEQQHWTEINLIMRDIEHNGYYTKIDISWCNAVTDIAYLPIDATRAEADAFFNNEDATVINPIYRDSMLTGYVKFTYTVGQKNSLVPVLLTTNLFCIALFGCVAALLYVIREQIIKPFESVSDMPEQLARGQMIKSSYLQKSPFFGRFVWGLDMLRESLYMQKLQTDQYENEKKSAAASLWHEIKAPMNAIKLYATALKEQIYDDPQKQREVIERIEKKAFEIDSYMRGLMNGKKDILHVEVTNQAFTMQALIDRLNDALAEKLELLKSELIVGTYLNGVVYGDLERTVEALESIIENAMQYGDGQQVRVNFLREDDNQLIVVSNRVNMPANAEITRLFDSYWRGSGADTQNESVNLHVARQIMNKMDGDVYADVENDNMNVTLVLKMAS